MRTISRLGCALMLTAFLSTVGAAQQAGEPFENSWYWGVGVGKISFPTARHRVSAPMLGADWLITRSRWALDVYGAQAFFTDVTTIADPNPSGFRQVEMTDLRRVGFQGIVFLPTYEMVRPYAGVGMSFNFINKASPLGAGYANAAQRDSVLARVNDARALAKATFAGGVMATWHRFAPYTQVTIMPTKGSGQWLINGNDLTWFWELGLRYNFGSALEKIK